MANIWNFTIQNNTVTAGRRVRKQISGNGCNEPFKDRYWCPKRQWFNKDICPFMNRRECENYEAMCGCI